jgi:hypothetical protein
MRSYSPNAKRRWKVRAARAIGLWSVNPIQRALLNELWETQKAMEHEADATKRAGYQRTYVKLIQTLRTLAHR